MAPIHHHFELAGWPETTVIIRFWILAGLCTALALGIFYADFVHLTAPVTLDVTGSASTGRCWSSGSGSTGPGRRPGAARAAASDVRAGRRPARAEAPPLRRASSACELVEAPDADRPRRRWSARSTSCSRAPVCPSATRRSRSRPRPACRSWASSTSPRPGTTGPCVAITGTNGKTTVTTLVTAMLGASGIVAVDAGNTEVPLVAAIDDPDLEVFVVEASSFRLGHCAASAPASARG